ncbi:MAG TPA: IS110 family transposase [Longimicrobium sp.]|nr:IS110 family transposase [Longimicrobium sp.]
MEVLYPRCAGLDIHKDLVVACARIARDREVRRELAEFGTTTKELLRLLDWLSSFKITHVAMESTGVYWKPVWHVLEGSFSLVLGNAKQMKHVPGRKSDQKDASWIADLLAHGLIRSSFVPPQPIQELRDLTRTRKQLVRERARHIQRLQKVLEDANVKLASVLSDIMGVSGRRILEALVAGERDTMKMARLAHPSVKASRIRIAEALEGRVTEHHRFMLALHLRHMEGIETEVQILEERIRKAVEPFRRAVEIIATHPGVREDAAAAILAEIGPDMRVFPSADHAVAWACLSPGLNETGGKKKSSPTRRAKWLKSTLTQCAWAASHKRDSYMSAQYHRIKSRRGKKKAIVAVAATILRDIYHMLQNEVPYQELGVDFQDRRNRERTARRLLKRLSNLGYDITLPRAA